MSEQQQQQMESSFDSLQANFDRLISVYNSSDDSLSPDLSSLYARMRDMHQQMEGTYAEMMAMHGGRQMEGRGMMGGMERHRHGHMTGEWYRQMMAMHEQMAEMHDQRGQHSLARMNRRLSHRFETMMELIPGIDDPLEEPREEGAESAVGNGDILYSQHCASCHGSEAGGIAGAFPPLANSKWITRDKKVPIRILLHGLTGEIDVGGRTYRGTMPSFRMRLSDAEIAAILTYLRTQSEGNFNPVSADDVADVRMEYRKRTQPWDAGELRKE